MTQEQFFARYKYDLDTDLLGGGGFGKVYKAFDDTLNRYLAIKVSELKKGQESLSLMKEVELAASLPKDKNIAHYEECFRFKLHNGTFDYGILQYYPLGNLSQLVKSKKLSEAEKENIANGIISGIQHLHGNNVVHRDLKSANILMAEGYQGEYVPKIADFGLSKQFTENENSYFSNSFAGGSLLYVAPEQLEGKELRKNVDLWSLGVVLYELFVGETPFKASVDDGSETARAEIISKIKNASIPSAIATVPSKWQEVIRGCLVTDPTRRTKSIEDIKGKVGIVSGGNSENTVVDTYPPKKDTQTIIDENQDEEIRITEKSDINSNKYFNVQISKIVTFFGLATWILGIFSYFNLILYRLCDLIIFSISFIILIGLILLSVKHKKYLNWTNLAIINILIVLIISICTIYSHFIYQEHLLDINLVVHDEIVEHIIHNVIRELPFYLLLTGFTITVTPLFINYYNKYIKIN